MKAAEIYTDQVDLLLDVLPIINQFECFAIKGGTAINMFIQDMPRLSVDIDLAYLPIEPREITLKNIDSEIHRISESLQQKNLRVEKKEYSKLVVYGSNSSIIIEPNLIIRGTVYDCEQHDLCQRAQAQFLKYSSNKILSVPDLYGGKICAMLDRKHPRDIFDIKYLLETIGLTDEVRWAFIVYLVSGNRPMSDILEPRIDIEGFKSTFESSFSGMTETEITAFDLITIFQSFVEELIESLTGEEKKFILSVKLGNPNWSLIPVDEIERLPAIQWKIKNINKMPREKMVVSFDKLKKALRM